VGVAAKQVLLIWVLVREVIAIGREIDLVDFVKE